jgi:hypothetical protein
MDPAQAVLADIELTQSAAFLRFHARLRAPRRLTTTAKAPP